MTIAIESERDNRENFDLESLPEYIRENKVKTREFSLNMSSIKGSDTDASGEVQPTSPQAGTHSDVLETLWPGVHQEFTNPPRRGPSFYLTVGFMAGAVISMAGVWTFSAVSHMVASSGTSGGEKQILVAQGGVTAPAPVPATHPTVPGAAQVIVPIANTYEVQPGDTLAGIALRNYKHASPRLLDEICKVNGMRNANVLSLGQKLLLPEYRPNASLATSPASSIQ